MFKPIKVHSGLKTPGFECGNQMQSSGTVENLTTGCQSEIGVLTVLCNVYQIISHTASTHPHQCQPSRGKIQYKRLLRDI